MVVVVLAAMAVVVVMVFVVVRHPDMLARTGKPCHAPWRALTESLACKRQEADSR